MDLDSMKYAELRSLAKELGLKANTKADKLLKAIKQHYQQEEQEDDGKGEEKDPTGAQEDQTAAQDDVQEEKDATFDEPSSSMALFVTNRRGRRTKRKISGGTDPVAVGEPKLPLSAAEKDTEAESGAACHTGVAKRRRVSSIGASGPPEEETPVATGEQQPEVEDGAAAHCDGESEPKVSKAGKIPRHEGLLKKKRSTLKPNTPNFKKLHEAHFNKMESIDSYVQRKTKQMDTYRHSVKELKTLSEKTTAKPTDGKIEVVRPSRASVFSPVVVNKRLPVNSDCKPAPIKTVQKEDAPFRPSVLSTRRINVRFSEVTRDNEHKRTLVKTPARMSHCVASSTPQKQTNDGVKPNNLKTSTISVTKMPGAFVFTANNSSVSNTPGTQKKPSFDLKASLSRPLSYKPHKGKLKAFVDPKENTAENSTVISHSHQKNYKQHQVQTRAERRTKQKEDRKQKKESMLGARRGLVMA